MLQREHPDDEGPLVLRVEEINFNAFDAVYPAEGYENDKGCVSTYAYNVGLFADYYGRELYWAQAAEESKAPRFDYDPHGLLDSRPALYSLKPGQFIKAIFRPRDDLPGAYQHWQSSQPDCDSIYYVRFTFARKSERWDVPGESPKRKRVKGNLAEGAPTLVSPLPSGVTWRIGKKTT